MNQKDPNLHYGYQRMTTALKIIGYLVNHRKVSLLSKTNKTDIEVLPIIKVQQTLIHVHDKSISF